MCFPKDTPNKHAKTKQVGLEISSTLGSSLSMSLLRDRMLVNRAIEMAQWVKELATKLSHDLSPGKCVPPYKISKQTCKSRMCVTLSTLNVNHAPHKTTSQLHCPRELL